MSKHESLNCINPRSHFCIKIVSIVMDVGDIPIVIGAVVLNPTVQTQRRRVRRQQQRSLPEIFLVYKMVDCKIVCAVVLATCSVVVGGDNASWCVARVAMLQQAAPVPRERTAYLSNVFSLRADFELEPPLCRLRGVVLESVVS